MPTPEELVSAHDKEKRLEDEARIIAASENMDDPENAAMVNSWLVREQIEVGKLLRVIVATLSTCVTKEECEEKINACPGRLIASKGWTWGKILGVTGGSTPPIVAVCYTILKLTGKL